MSEKRRNYLDRTTRAYTKSSVATIEVAIGNRDDLVSKYGTPEEYLVGLQPVWIKIYSGSGKFIALNVSAMTVEELDAAREVINLALDDAEVVCKALDEHAYKVLQDGEAEVPRRALASAPPLFVRELPLTYDEPEREQGL